MNEFVYESLKKREKREKVSFLYISVVYSDMFFFVGYLFISVTLNLDEKKEGEDDKS
jgi:hypothetical protein